MAGQQSEFKTIIRLAGMVDPSYAKAFRNAQTIAKQFSAIYEKGGAKAVGKELGIYAAGKGMQLAGKAIKASADLAVSGLQAMYGYVKDSIPLAAEYGSQMRQVAKFVDEFRVATEDANGTKFEFTDEYKNFYNELLGMKSIYTPTQLAEIAAQNAKAQIPAGQLIDSVQLAQEIGAAFDSDAQTAGGIIRELVSNQGMNLDQVRDLADSVNRVENESNADALALMRIIASQGSLADIGGIDQATLAAIGATLGANNGGFAANPDKIATSLKNVVMYLNGAAGKGSKARKEAMGQLGLSAAESAKMMQQEGGEFLKGLLEQTMNLPADKRLSVLGAIFGQQASGDAAKLAKNLDKLDEYMKLAHNKGGSTVKDEYNYTMEDPLNKYAAFQNRLEGLKISVGGALLPGLEAFMDEAMGPLAEASRDMAGPIAEFGAEFGRVLGIVVKDPNVKAAFKELCKQAPKMLGSLLPAIPALATGVATVAPALAELSTSALEIMVSMLNDTIPILAPALEKLANAAEWAIGIIESFTSLNPFSAVGRFKDATLAGATPGQALFNAIMPKTDTLMGIIGRNQNEKDEMDAAKTAETARAISAATEVSANIIRTAQAAGIDPRTNLPVPPTLSQLDDIINAQGGGHVELTYSPVWNVTPGTDVTRLKQTDAEMQRDFEQRADRYIAKKGRVDFAKG